jgi:hypothetical protein
VKVAWIYKDELVEKKLKMGDVIHIDAGSTFHMVNTGKGQRLHVICSIDASDDGLGFGPPYQVSCPCSLFGKFFSPPTQAGETVDATVGLLPRWLAGFEPKTLAVAFNVSYYSWIFINPQHALQSPTETVGCMPNRFPVQRIRPQSTNWQEPCRHKPAAPSCTTKRSWVVARRRSGAGEREAMTSAATMHRRRGRGGTC